MEKVWVTTELIQGRGRVVIEQQPDATNDYTTIVLLDDSTPWRADWYEFKLYHQAERDVLDEEEYGGTFMRWSHSGPLTLDPVMATDAYSAEFVVKLFDTLVHFKPGTTEIEPGLAESWEVSPDGTEYTFYLREGVKFHNGRVMTAQDVKYSFDRLMDPNTGSPRIGFAEEIDEVIVVNESVVKIRTMYAFVPFLSKLTYSCFSPVPREEVERWGDDWFMHPVGTGPFKFGWWNVGCCIELQAFDEYWGGRPRLDRYSVYLYDDAETRWQGFKAGHVSLTAVPSPAWEEYLADEIMRNNSITVSELSTYWLVFNCGEWPFKEKAIRNAFCYALQKEKVLETVFVGNLEARGPIPPGLWGFDQDLYDGYNYTYDPQAAKDLLDRAGIRDTDGDGIREYEGKPLSFELSSSESYAWRDAAETFAAHLREVGMEMTYQEYDFVDLLAAQVDGDYSLMSMGWIADYPDPENFMLLFESKNIPGLNGCRFSNTTFDQLADWARKERNETKRLDYYRQMSGILMEENPHWWFLHPQTTYVWQPWVHGIKIGGFGFRNEKCLDVWIERPPDITANFSMVPVSLDGEMSEEEWADAGGVDFPLAANDGEVNFRIKYDPDNEWIYLVFSIPDTSYDMFDYVFVYFDMNHNGAPDTNDYIFTANRFFGEAWEYGWDGSDWSSVITYPMPWDYAVSGTTFGWAAEFRIPVSVSDGERWGIGLRQMDWNAPFFRDYPWGFHPYQPETWTDLVFSKQSSSINLVLSETSLVTGDNTTITATILPQVSTGTVTLSYSHEKGPWETMASGPPQMGLFSYIWSPTTLGTYEVKAYWTGDWIHRNATSTNQTLILSLPTITFDSSPRVSPVIVDGMTYGPMDLPKSFTWQMGSTHNFSIPGMMVDGEMGVRYVFDQWSDGSRESERTLTATTHANYMAQFRTEHHLEVSSSYGNPKGEGWYVVGVSAPFSVSSPVDHGNGTRHVFVGWMGDSSATTPSASIEMDAPHFVAASWKKQYSLSVDSQYGLCQGAGWYDAGVSATFGVSRDLIDQGNSTRRVFTSWSGDSTSTTPSSSIRMNAPKTVTAQFKTQFYVNVTSPYDSPTGSDWHDKGTTVTFSVSSPVDYGNRSRHTFVQWSGDSTSDQPSSLIMVDSPKLVEAGWRLQHFLSVESEIGDPKGEGWHDSGSEAGFSVTEVVDFGNDTRAVFDAWEGDSTVTSSSAKVGMSRPKKVTTTWRIQHRIKISSPHGDPQGAGWYDVNTRAQLSVLTPIDHGNHTRRVFLGWSGDATGTSPTVDLVAESPKMVSAGWKTQYFLVVESRYGDPKGEGWHDVGTQAAYSISTPVDHDNGTRRIFTRWSGDLTSTSPHDTVTINVPKAVKAEWKTQFYFTVDPNGGEATGEGWYDQGSEATATATSPAAILEGTSRLIFEGWSGDKESEEAGVSLTVFKPSMVKANWKTQFYLEINPRGGEVSQSSQWLDGGTTIDVEATTPCKIDPEKCRLVFIEWSGAVETKVGTASITMDCEKTLVANWQKEHYLNVVSDYGEPQGEGWCPEGERATFSVDSPIGAIIQKRFSSWSGDSTAETETAVIVMDAARTVTVVWRTDYTQLLILLAAVVIAGAGGAFAVKKRKKKE